MPTSMIAFLLDLNASGAEAGTVRYMREVAWLVFDLRSRIQPVPARVSGYVATAR